jgi:hypothetical protein
MIRTHSVAGRSRRILSSTIATALIAGGAWLGATAGASAQDTSGALIDALVREGVLSQQKADKIRSDVEAEAAHNSANKIKLSDSVSSLKLYGDLSLMWQYNDNKAQIDNGANLNQQSRWRYRLHLNADFDLGPNWFAGVQLQTNNAADSGKQTYSSGFNNDGIFISRAFLGWHNDWLNITAGKQKNPFYTTDLLWDPDINPAGLTETIAFHRMPLFGGAGGPTGDGKDVKGVTEPGHVNPWEVSLVAGQFIFGDNNEFNNTGDLSSDPWIFDQQLITTYRFNKDTSVTVAPGFLVESAGHLSGAINTLPFTDEGAIVSGTTARQVTTQNADVVQVTYDANGVPTKVVTPVTTTTTTQTTVTPNNQTVGTATVSGPRTITSTATAARGKVTTTVGAATGLATDPSKAGQQFTTTNTQQGQTVSTTNNNSLPGITGETRALHIITAPGDISFKLGGLKSKIYWDLAYNVSGRERFDDVYQLKDFGSRPYKSRDALAWLAGVQVGELKKRGDWAAFFDYRETGIASVDPNLNDSEAAGGSLNSRGFKLSVAYQLADAVVVRATGYEFWNLDENLFGGRATSAGGIAPYNSYQELQLDISIKF